MTFTGDPDGDPDKVKSQTVTDINQFSLDHSTSAPFAMAYVGTNGRVFNNPIIRDLLGADNVFANIVGELIADITAGVQVLLGQR